MEFFYEILFLCTSGSLKLLYISRVYYDITNITDNTKINDIVQIFKEDIYIWCKANTSIIIWV